MSETYEGQKRHIIQMITETAQRDFPEMPYLEAAKLATETVEAFERAAQAAWTPTTGGMPETPKLAVGDRLLVVQHKTRYRPQFVQGAEVTAMARYRVSLAWVSLENGRPYNGDFDVRSRYPWVANKSADRIYSTPVESFFTEAQWAWEQRARLADGYLKERQIYPSSVGGPLARLFNEDRLGFANALRRLEGLVEL